MLPGVRWGDLVNELSRCFVLLPPLAAEALNLAMPYALFYPGTDVPSIVRYDNYGDLVGDRALLSKPFGPSAIGEFCLRF